MQVLDEVRDRNSRAFFDTLPFGVDVLEPSEEALAAVRKFAIGTGDIYSLSSPDLRLIALCYTLEAAAHGTGASCPRAPRHRPCPCAIEHAFRLPIANTELASRPSVSSAAEPAASHTAATRPVPTRTAQPHHGTRHVTCRASEDAAPQEAPERRPRPRAAPAGLGLGAQPGGVGGSGRCGGRLESAWGSVPHRGGSRSTFPRGR